MSQSRQLTAIMFTDVVGYTALMGNDEQKAFGLLNKNRQIQKPLIGQFNGKWIKELGDGASASFNTVSVYNNVSNKRLIMKTKISMTAQVPVREEPRHHLVVQNKYIRLLDVWIQPGDTTRFHIHATPSLFISLPNGVIGSQIKGEGWMNEKSVAGKTWYRSFSPDILVHRVCNPDTIFLHVNDKAKSIKENSPEEIKPSLVKTRCYKMN